MSTRFWNGIARWGGPTSVAPDGRDGHYERPLVSRTVRPLGRPLDHNPDYGYPLTMSSPVLSRDQTVARLSGCEQDIRALGVVRLALFGSVLRGQARATSDVDFIVQFAPGTKTYGRFFALSELLEAQLGRPVELVTTEALSPFIGPRILAEAHDVLRAA